MLLWIALCKPDWDLTGDRGSLSIGPCGVHTCCILLHPVPSPDTLRTHVPSDWIWLVGGGMKRCFSTEAGAWRGSNQRLSTQPQTWVCPPELSMMGSNWKLYWLSHSVKWETKHLVGYLLGVVFCFRCLWVCCAWNSLVWSPPLCGWAPPETRKARQFPSLRTESRKACSSLVWWKFTSLTGFHMLWIIK